MENVLNIILAVVQLLIPIGILVYTFLLRKRLKRINKLNRQVLDDYIEHSNEMAMIEFLRVNPDIDPVIFEEKKEPIVPSKEKLRHHFNHKGGDYFM
jgi:hypothetical protein